MIGPFTTEVFLHIVNPEAGAVGKVTFTIAPGRIPTEEDLHRLFGKGLAELPAGWRLMDSEEFFNRVVIKEMTGREGNFAIPDFCRFDAAALTAAALAAWKPDEEVGSEDTLREDNVDEDED